MALTKSKKMLWDFVTLKENYLKVMKQWDISLECKALMR